MATGGGGAGGGGFNFRLARAYVEIDVDLSRFTAGLASVQNRLQSLGARVSAALGGGRVGGGYFSYTAAGLDRVARSALGAARSLGSLAAAVAGAGVAAARAVGHVANVVATGAQLVNQFYRAVRLATDLVVQQIARRWSTIVGTALDAADHIVQGFRQAWATLSGTPLARDLGRAWNRMADVAFRAFSRVAWTAAGVGAAVIAAFEMAGSAVGRVFVGLADAFVVTAQAIWRTVGPLARGIGAVLRAYVGMAAREVQALAAMFWNDFGRPVLAVAARVASAFAGAWAAMSARLAPVAAYISATFQGIAAAGAAVATGFQRAWTRVAMNSAVWARMGRSILDAITRAFSNNASLFNALDRFRSAVGNAVGAAFGAVGRAGGAVASAFGSMARTAWSAFDRVAAAVEQTFLKVARGLGRALVKVASGFGGALAGTAKVLGATLLGGGLAAGAVGVVGGLLGREAARLESRQVAIQRVTGLDPKGAQALTESIRRMSVDLAGLPMEKLFGIAEMGARLGIEGKNLELFTRDIARVGQVLADMPIDEATTRIARLLAVFHEGPEAAIRLASALNRLDMASTATARDILDITSRLSGPASFLGMKPQQALALATALREAGVPLETGGTAMTQILTRMASRKDSAKFARTAGMATGQFEAVLGTDPLKAIKAFEEGLSRIDRAQGPIAAVRVLDELHLDGQRVRGTLLQLGRVMEQLNTYEALAAEEWRNTSSIMGGAAKVTQTLAAQWTRLGNTFRMAVQDLAMSLMPLFKGAVEGGRMLIEDIDSAIRGSGDFIKGWADWGGNLLKTLGMAVREWQTFVGLAEEFIGLQWDRVADIFGNIGTRFRQIFQFEKENIFVQVGQFFNTLMDWVVKWGGKAFSYIHDKFFKLIDYMLDKLKSLADYLVDSLTVAFSKVPLLRAFFSEEEVEGAKKRTAGGPAVAILKAAGVAVPTPDEPFPAPAGPEKAGPPFNPWEHLGAVFGVHEGVGAKHEAGIAAGLKALTQAMNFRQFVERASALKQDIMDRIARRGMEAVTGRRFAGAGAGAMPGDEEGGEAVAEAGGGVPAGPRAPSARDLARLRHREAIRAIQRRNRLLFTEKVDREGEESRKLTPAEMRERRAANAVFASTQARLANALRLFAHPGERLPLPLTGAMQRRLDAARAARGGLSPLQARIARVRARRHAGEGANQVANGIRAMQQGLIRLGSFISPEMRAKAAQEAQKQRDQKSAADAIAAALGIPSGDFYQRIGLAVAQAVKGLGALQ